MMNIRFKYKVALSSIVIMMVFVTLTGFSYAYFTTTIEGEGNEITATTAEVNMTFTEGEENANINLSNAYPVTDAVGLKGTPYTFNLTNPNDFNVKAYIFLSVSNDSDQELLSHIKVAYNNGTNLAQNTEGYTIKFLDTNATTEVPTDSTKWQKVTDTVVDGYTSYLLDTIDINTTEPKENLKLLLWIDKDTGGVVECTTSPDGTTTCTLPNSEQASEGNPEECETVTDAEGKQTTICTPKSDTMNKSFKARISVRAIPDREPYNQPSSGYPVSNEPQEPGE